MTTISTRFAARIAVFLDGDVLQADRIGFRMDWKRLRDQQITLFPDDIATFHFFMVEILRNNISEARTLYDFVQLNGYRLHTIEAPFELEGSINRSRNQLLVAMTADMMAQAHAGAQEIVIWSGDQALAPVITAIQQAGAKVTVVFSKDWCSPTLRRLADNFIDISKYRAAVMKAPKETAA